MYPSISVSTGILGLFIALPLLAGWRKRPAAVWLGLFVFSICWLSLKELYWDYPRYLFGVFDLPLPGLGAFYYCYLRELIGLGNGRRQLWHFLPLAVWDFGLLTARVLVDPVTLYHWVESHWQLFLAALLGFQLLALAYVPLVGVRLLRFRAQLKDNYSSVGQRDLKWLSSASLVLIAILVLWIPATQIRYQWLLDAFVIARLAVLFFLGWYGMYQFPVTLPAPVDVPESPVEKYVRSGMNDAAEQLIGERLARRAERDRDYLEPDLKLTDLAERIGTSPHLLSQYLNRVLDVNFFDYVNGLRIAEVQSKMADASHADSSLLDIAFAAGFSSKSTFNASFKKITGMAPSVWRNLHVRTSEPIG